MKILHLIEDLIGTVKTQKNYNGLLGQRNINYNTGRKALGSGHFSSVKNHPNDPHLVKKHSKHVETKSDGYNIFIEYLINHDLTDNIHFPKIYNITAITDKYDNRIHTYTLEKLVPFREANTKELEFFIQKTFSDMLNKEVIRNMAMFSNRLDLSIAYIITDLMYGDVSLNEIIDDSFREAVSIIMKIEKETSFTNLDVKADNMMWRRTPHGLVLVFTDPIS